MKISSHLFISALFLAAVLLGLASLPATAVPYRTSFEEPGIAPGTIDGQDGWKAVPTGSGFVQNASFVKKGSHSLMISASAEVSRPLPATGEFSVYVDGYYRGPVVSATPDPATLPEGTSLILFHSTQGILVLNGDGNGGGTWESTGVAVSPNSLQRITIAQDYQTSTWSLYIDEVLRAVDIGFKDNSITQLNGISIETASSGEGYLDDLAVTTSPPDFLAQPPLFFFQADWAKQDGGFNWDLSPLSPDGRVNAHDLLEVLKD